MKSAYTRKNQKQFESLKLDIAIEEVKAGRLSIRKAAENYCISKSSLQRVLKIVDGESRFTSCNKVFSPELERLLIEHVRELQTLTYGVTHDSLRCLAYEFAVIHGVDHPFSHERRRAGPDWVIRFLKRHPELLIVRPERIRQNHFNDFLATKFYQLLDKIITKECLKPESMFCMGPIDIATTDSNAKITSEVGVISSTGTEMLKTITAIMCASATGNYVPPCLVFARKDIDRKSVPVPALGSKPTGLITEVFPQWLDYFINYIKPSIQNKILLILDTYGSRIPLEVMQKAKSEGILLLTIPPTTSIRLQPFLQSLDGPLRESYDQQYKEWARKHCEAEATVITEAEFFARAYVKCSGMENSVNGFRLSGIYPFNSQITKNIKNRSIEIETHGNAPNFVQIDEERKQEIMVDESSKDKHQFSVENVWIKEEPPDPGTLHELQDTDANQLLLFQAQQFNDSSHIKTEASDHVDLSALHSDIIPRSSDQTKAAKFTLIVDECDGEQCKIMPWTDDLLSSTHQINCLVHFSEDEDLKLPEGCFTLEMSHLHRTLSDDIYFCDKCPFSTRYKMNLQCHVDGIHNKLKPFQCGLCDYRTLRKRDLIPHINAIHSGEKEHKCPHCEYKTAYKQHVTVHIQAVHENVKPYGCGKCSYRAAIRGNLLKHIRNVHEKERGHACHLCDYRANQKCNLLRHIKYIHDKVPRSTKEPS